MVLVALIIAGLVIALAFVFMVWRMRRSER
jgi:hypothetical protein